MSWVTGIVVYLLIWWTSLFVVLPWGVRRNESAVAGVDEGAPENPHMKIKVIANTVLATVIWIGIYFAIENEIVSFRGMIR